MKKLSLLAWSIAIPSIAVTPAIVLTSCSDSSDPFSKLVYGQDVSCKKDDREDLQKDAQNHLQQIYPAKTISSAEAQTFITNDPLNEISFYWEFLIYCCQNKHDIHVSDWKYESSTLTFNASWGGGSISADNPTTFSYSIEEVSGNKPDHINIKLSNNGQDYYFTAYHFASLLIDWTL